MDIVWKIIFFVFILPFYMMEKGYEMLNEYLEKRGMEKITWLHVVVFSLILLLLVLWSIGFRW